MFQQAAHRSIPGAVATVGVSDRTTFLRKTYSHLGMAVLAFIGLAYVLLDGEAVYNGRELIAVSGNALFKGITVPWINVVMGNSWLLVLALFMGASWLANKWANSDTSKGIQYAGLGLYVVAEALILTPILYIANTQMPGVIADAAVLTLFLFGGLTATVFITKKDFSFMRGALVTAGFGVMGLIVASILFGFQLGTLFSAAMIFLASAYILYYTSNVMHHYRPAQYVAASLALFSALALLFFYVLRILMSLRD